VTLRAGTEGEKAMSEYSQHDCGGPDVCSGCSSWRHGVYEDGSGDPKALEMMRRRTVRSMARRGTGDER
jgi:hypothetical protein